MRSRESLNLCAVALSAQFVVIRLAMQSLRFASSAHWSAVRSKKSRAAASPFPKSVFHSHENSSVMLPARFLDFIYLIDKSLQKRNLALFG
jgi:hypothetical protein